MKNNKLSVSNVLLVIAAVIGAIGLGPIVAAWINYQGTKYAVDFPIWASATANAEVHAFTQTAEASMNTGTAVADLTQKAMSLTPTMSPIRTITPAPISSTPPLVDRQMPVSPSRTSTPALIPTSTPQYYSGRLQYFNVSSNLATSTCTISFGITPHDSGVRNIFFEVYYYTSREPVTRKGLNSSPEAFVDRYYNDVALPPGSYFIKIVWEDPRIGPLTDVPTTGPDVLNHVQVVVNGSGYCLAK